MYIPNFMIFRKRSGYRSEREKKLPEKNNALKIRVLRHPYFAAEAGKASNHFRKTIKRSAGIKWVKGLKKIVPNNTILYFLNAAM